jgi:S1-C subfamily serine protease
MTASTRRELRSADHTKHFPVSVEAIDNDRDLAVLKIPEELNSLQPIPVHNGSPVANGSAAILCGYPNHFAARPLRIEHGLVIRTFPKGGISYLEITPKIIAGNSGGPLLNEAYEFIGVAVRGINETTTLTEAEFLAVNGTELRDWRGI